MAFIKALIPGVILTFVIAIILGSNRVSGGWLNVHQINIEQASFYWSWPLFLISTGIAWFVFSTTE
jgi:hypothetical protein